MRVIQFELSGGDRRVGVLDGDEVIDVTAASPEFTRVTDVFHAARRSGSRFADLLGTLAAESTDRRSYAELLSRGPGDERGFLHAPVDHPEPHRLFVTGTGLTHTGGMKSRDQMHTDSGGPAAEEPQTDSAKMFAMGLAGGKPQPGERGTAPEWFYKGNGTTLRGPNAELEIPPFAPDGGEEPELAGIYVIDADGTPWRLGFTLGNEWSDHVTEQMNYLYLAPSKLRTCAIGPELITDCDFQSVRIRCSVTRGDACLYDSGELLSGEQNMCHSLANCEDHHFKYPLHRYPGDVHVHFFGTSKLSHSTRDWTFQPGDVVRVESPDLGAPLTNRIAAGADDSAAPVRVSV